MTTQNEIKIIEEIRKILFNKMGYNLDNKTIIKICLEAELDKLINN